MNYVTDLIDDGDLCALIFVVIIMVAIGQRLVQGRPNSQLWGLRIAAANFLVFAVVRGVELAASTADDLLSALIVGLLASALLLGPTWIVLAILEFSHERYQKLMRSVRASAEMRRTERQQRRQRRDRERAARELQQRTPEQQRAERRAAEEQRRLEAQREESARRREDAIAACELLYQLREPDIGRRFPREQLDKFIQKYMGADRSTEVIERRADELRQVIQQLHEAVDPPTRFTELSQLTAWYEQQKQQVQSLSVAEMHKEDYLAQLNERYTELMQQILEKL